MIYETQKKRDDTVSARRAFGMLVPLCLAAALLACVLISTANDIYAFVKPDQSITVTVLAPISAKQFSVLLRENGVIRNELVFFLYLRSKNKANDVGLLSGSWELNSNMSYRDIMLKIFQK